MHIYSAMPVLLLMIFFAVTGLYLNHPEFDAGDVTNQKQTLTLPKQLSALPNWPEYYAQHSLLLLHWLDSEHNIRGVDFDIEWDDFDSLLILNLAGPNGSTVVEVLLEDREVLVDERQLSLLAMLNNVHRAKHVSGLWRLVSDLSAVCMLLFCFSGFWLVIMNKFERRNANIALVFGSSFFVLIILLMH